MPAFMANDNGETVTLPSKEWKRLIDYASRMEVAAITPHGDMLIENEVLRRALRIIAGREQCADNLMSNVDVAIAALDTTT